MTAEEMEAKRKARMERFGAVEVSETKRSDSSGKHHKMNRRKAKLMRKLNQKKGSG